MTVSIALAPGSDYRFAVTVEAEEACLSAERRGAAADEYFWYHQFEDAAFPNVKALYDSFHRELTIVVGHQTRIIQARGLMMWDFSCAAHRWRPACLFVNGSTPGCIATRCLTERCR